MFAPGPLAPPPMPAMPPIPQVKHTPLPPEQAALLDAPPDPFNQTQHEAKMNDWYMKYIDHQNSQKIALYIRAYSDWRDNAERFQQIGRMDLCPPPPALPVLVEVGPMPTGYWFGRV